MRSCETLLPSAPAPDSLSYSVRCELDFSSKVSPTSVSVSLLTGASMWLRLDFCVRSSLVKHGSVRPRGPGRSTFGSLPTLACNVYPSLMHAKQLFQVVCILRSVSCIVQGAPAQFPQILMFCFQYLSRPYYLFRCDFIVVS